MGVFYSEEMKMDVDIMEIVESDVEFESMSQALEGHQSIHTK